MASLSTAPAETDALRGGGIDHHDAHRKLSPVCWRVGVAVAATGALVCLGVVAATALAPAVGPSTATNLAVSAMLLRGTFSAERGRQDDSVERVVDEPPRAWEVLSDLQPGPPAGQDDDVAQAGPDRLRDMLLERFGLAEPGESKDAPAPANRDEQVAGTQENGDAEGSSKQQLKEKLLETFGLSGPQPPSDNAQASEALTTGNEVDDEALKNQLKHELRGMLLHALMPSSDSDTSPNSWNWLDPTADSYRQVARAAGSEGDVDVQSVLSYLREQHAARSQELVSYGVDAQYARTVSCFARGAKQIRKLILSRDDFERVVGWMNNECEAVAATGDVEDADEPTASPTTDKAALEKPRKRS